MKRNRMIVMFIAVMLVSMQFNIVTFAEEYSENYLLNHKNNYLDSIDLVYQNFGTNFAVNFDDCSYSSLSSDISNYLNNYQYVYVKYDSPSSYCIFADNSPFRVINYKYRSYSTSNSLQDSGSYLEIVYDGDCSPTPVYIKRTGSSVSNVSFGKLNTKTVGDKSFKYYQISSARFCWSNVPVYNGNEVMSFLGLSFDKDTVIEARQNGSVPGIKYFSDIIGILLNNIDSFTDINTFTSDYMYVNAEIDTSSEGSNNALSQFTMCGVADSKYYSNYGLALNYALSDTASNTYSKGKLCVDYTITIRMVEQNANNVLPVKTLKCSQKYDLSGSSGSVDVDLFGLISSNMLSSVSDVVQYGAILRALNGTSVDGVTITKTDTINEFMHNDKFLKAINVNDFLDTVSYTYNDVVYTYVFDTFTVSAKAYVSNGSTSTNRRNASVDLVKGNNNSYNYVGVDSDNLSPDTSDVINNTNYFVNTDNGYKYYNSVTNEVKDCGDIPYVSLGDIVVNVEVSGGGGSSGSMVQNNNVSFPDNILIKIQELNDVTIQDDDLTYDSLSEHLKEGFGLMDDDSTIEYGDGFIYLISNVYSGIDPNLKILIMWGVSTTIGIAVIRMIFKR